MRYIIDISLKYKKYSIFCRNIDDFTDFWPIFWPTDFRLAKSCRYRYISDISAIYRPMYPIFCSLLVMYSLGIGYVNGHLRLKFTKSAHTTQYLAFHIHILHFLLKINFQTPLNLFWCINFIFSIEAFLLTTFISSINFLLLEALFFF